MKALTTSEQRLTRFLDHSRLRATIIERSAQMKTENTGDPESFDYVYCSFSEFQNQRIMYYLEHTLRFLLKENENKSQNSK